MGAGGRVQAPLARAGERAWEKWDVSSLAYIMPLGGSELAAGECGAGSVMKLVSYYFCIVAFRIRVPADPARGVGLTW
jgi:hypothetical protein